MAVGCDDTIGRVWSLPMKAAADVPAPRLLGSENSGHEDWIHSCALSANGELAVTGADDGTARLWRIPMRVRAARIGHARINM